MALPAGKTARFAHHPHCERHAHHLLWFGHTPICLGCACLYAGALVGAGASLWFAPQTVAQLPWLALGLVFGVAPTALQPFLQKRAFKIFARSSLGVATGAFWMALLWSSQLPFPRWMGVLGGALWFALVARLMVVLRNRFTANPCDVCPLGSYPICSWSLSQMQAADVDAKLRLPLVDGRT